MVPPVQHAKRISRQDVVLMPSCGVGSMALLLWHIMKCNNDKQTGHVKQGSLGHRLAQKGAFRPPHVMQTCPHGVTTAVLVIITFPDMP
jgi:hypothetical protein